MIWGFDTENDQAGNLTIACACSRKQRFYLTPGPLPRADLHRVWMLEAKIEPVHVWAINLEYDLINFYGAKMPDFLTLQFGRHKIVGATMKGAKVIFRDVCRFIVRKTGDEIGELLNVRKMKVDLQKLKDNDLPKETLKRYCMRDADIGRRSGEAIESALMGCGVGL